MPTYETLPRFTTDLDRLTRQQRLLFRWAVTAFVYDLRTGRFRVGLREPRGIADSRPPNARNPCAEPLSQRFGARVPRDVYG
ncbi:hypothetical protein SGFS_004190 [Streptomyces graminofaciens]|uniref:Uncharacterized protein n=1 Tax=Streptomyces graminofaciens TaxID=68212 RepID=A0ABM7F0I8_9ACTN|nr:hypothetical protein [Streptomyces graminofaciens]BBC29128.1 hypothetical protein SGFS_004190 [Streptomyces graminofaciens]